MNREPHETRERTQMPPATGHRPQASWLRWLLVLLSLGVTITAQAQLPSCTAARFPDYRDLNCWLRGQTFRNLPCPPCPPGTTRAQGMPRWNVTAPFQNVWVTDTPLSYPLSSGATMDFQWTHRQRYSLPEVYTFSHVGDGRPSFINREVDSLAYGDRRNRGATNAAWWHNWQADILFWDYAYEYRVSHIPSNSPYAHYQEGYEAYWFTPEGAVQYFYKTNFGSGQQLDDPTLRTRLEPLSPLGWPTSGTPVAGTAGLYWGDGQTNGFQILYADGRRELYGLTHVGRAFLTQRIDRQGRITRLGYEFGWETNAITGQQFRGAYRVRLVVDYEGRTNTFRYANPYALWQVTEVEDPYGRKVRLEYGSHPGPNKIIDAVGLTNSFAYLPAVGVSNWVTFPLPHTVTNYYTNGWLSSYTTPYGTTSFEYYDQLETNSSEAFYQKRAVRVTEADGSKQLFLYHHKTDFSTPAAVTAPTNVSGFTFDDGATGSLAYHPALYHRNSFHWNARQYSALTSLAGSHAGLSNQLSSITSSNAYQLARLQHWLLGNDTITATDYLSSEREPSLDAAGTQAGSWTFYAYGNTSEPELEPSDPFVTAIARVMPDGTTQFQSIDAVNPATGQPTRQRENYTLPNGTVGFRTNWFTYSTNGLDLLVASNSLGQFTKSTWSTDHQLLGLTNALNETASVTYLDVLTEWKPQTVRLPGGQTVTYTYYLGNWTNINGTNVYVWRPDARFVKQVQYNPGPTWQFGYDKGLVKHATNDLGLWLTFTWDNLLRLTGTVFPDGSYTSNRYDKLDLVATRDRLGNWTTAGYDALQRPTAITNANQAVTHLDWCGCGALNSITDALTNTTWFYYNNQGVLTNRVVRDANLNPQSATFYAYDSAQRLTQIKDGLNRSLQLGYNIQGLITTVSNAYGQLERTRYDAADRPVEITDAHGVTVANHYDLLDRITQRTRLDGFGEQYGWSTNGLIAYTNRNQEVTRYHRDAAGRLLAITNANLEVTRVQLNSRGQATDLFDGLNHRTQFAYDEYGRRRSRTDALNRTTHWNYNPNGWLTNLVTPQFGNTVYSYDNVGNLTNIIYPVGTGSTPSVTFRYDALNRLTNMVDALGVTKFTHTALGQLQTEDGPWTDDTVTLTYTEGQRTAMSVGSTWSQSYGYDAAWRMTGISAPSGTFGYTYHATRITQLTGITLPNGSWITNDFDSLGRLRETALKNRWGHTLDGTSYTHDLLGLRTNLFRDFGWTASSVTAGYDDIGQLTTWNAQETGGVPRHNEQLGWHYDAAGNLNRRTNGSLVQTFTVDPNNQLSTINRSGPLTVTGNTPAPATNVTVNGNVADRYADFTFARTNNAQSGTPNPFTIIAQSTNGLNATNTATYNLPASISLSYDLNGNLTNDGLRNFTYDADNQLTTNWVTGQWKTELVYDGLGRRRITRDYTWNSGVGTWNLTNTTRQIYDGLLPIQERDANNNTLVTYTRGLDFSGSIHGAGGIGGLLARTDNAGSTFYHADGSGNITALMNCDGDIVARYLYNPFGKLTGKWGSLADANVMRFSSMPYHDKAGLSL